MTTCGLSWKPNRTMMWSITQVQYHRKRNWVVMTDQIRCHLRWKPNRTTMWPIIQVWFTLKMILNYHGWLDWLSIVAKTRYKNNMIDHVDAVNVENKTNVLWPIGLGVDCDEKQIEQWHDWSYWCHLCQKWN